MNEKMSSQDVARVVLAARLLFSIAASARL